MSDMLIDRVTFLLNANREAGRKLREQQEHATPRPRKRGVGPSSRQRMNANRRAPPLSQSSMTIRTFELRRSDCGEDKAPISHLAPRKSDVVA
jgi:hypothetical protein